MVRVPSIPFALRRSRSTSSSAGDHLSTNDLARSRTDSTGQSANTSSSSSSEGHWYSRWLRTPQLSPEVGLGESESEGEQLVATPDDLEEGDEADYFGAAALAQDLEGDGEENWEDVVREMEARVLEDVFDLDEAGQEVDIVNVDGNNDSSSSLLPHPDCAYAQEERATTDPAQPSAKPAYRRFTSLPALAKARLGKAVELANADQPQADQAELENATKAYEEAKRALKEAWFAACQTRREIKNVGGKAHCPSSEAQERLIVVVPWGRFAWRRAPRELRKAHLAALDRYDAAVRVAKAARARVLRAEGGSGRKVKETAAEAEARAEAALQKQLQQAAHRSFRGQRGIRRLTRVIATSAKAKVLSASKSAGGIVRRQRPAPPAIPESEADATDDDEDDEDADLPVAAVGELVRPNVWHALIALIFLDLVRCFVWLLERVWALSMLAAARVLGEGVVVGAGEVEVEAEQGEEAWWSVREVFGISTVVEEEEEEEGEEGEEEAAEGYSCEVAELQE